MSSAAVSKIVEKWREHPPSSYSLKVHNFSQLENSTSFSDDKYQSRLFPSGGYNWRLIVHPKGNEKDNGSGFISMYVEIDDKSTEVFAELRFFVYNKKDNKYFTIQDVEVKRFNALKTVWGLPHVLPYDTFNNPDNGYVFEGDQSDSDKKVFMQGHVRVLDPLGSNHFARKLHNWYNESNSTGWGWVQFVSLTELLKLYLDKEDTLNVEIEFEVVSATKNSPII